MRLGVNRGTHTPSSVPAPSGRRARTPVTGEKLVVDDVQEVPRREPVGRRHDVGLAPADELLAARRRVNRPRSTVALSRRTESAGRRRPRSGQSTRQRVVDLIVRVRPDIGAGRKLQPRCRLDEHLLPHQQIADAVDRIVGGVLREIRAGRLDKTALGDGLRRDRLGRRRSAGRRPAAFLTGAGSPAA